MRPSRTHLTPVVETFLTLGSTRVDYPASAPITRVGPIALFKRAIRLRLVNRHPVNRMVGRPTRVGDDTGDSRAANGSDCGSVPPDGGTGREERWFHAGLNHIFGGLSIGGYPRLG